MKPKVFDEPSEVSADEGSVLVRGPDNVNIALSPDAAAITSDRLFQAALKAKRHRSKVD